MKPKLDLVNMLLVNINGRSSAPTVKKRKAKEVLTGVMLAENTPMLKSAYQFSKKFLTIVSLIFHIPLLGFHFPFYSLLWVGAIMSINTDLSVFLLRRTRHLLAMMIPFKV